jgi:queuine tRNA-ribosyltransferase
MSFNFQVKAQIDHARAGELVTPHGRALTPTFMPVGTQASVKSLSADDLVTCGAQIILGGNTYHMYLRPGMEVIKKAGGMHKFMNWHGPMLTDSGGFQVFSLGLGSRLKTDEDFIDLKVLVVRQQHFGVVSRIKLAKKGKIDYDGQRHSHCRNSQNALTSPPTNNKRLSEISDNGVWFKSHLDGSRHFMSPEKSIQIQKILGADIIMAFDECTPDNVPKSYVKQAMERTHAWLVRSKKEWLKNKCLSTTTHKYQALFGIIQGGTYKDLRRQSAEFIISQDLPGIAIGGETIGFNMDRTEEVIGWLRDLLPKDKPIYTMGLGENPQDLLRVVKLGIDLFDCVAPTRLARNGALYSGKLVVARRQNFDVTSRINSRKELNTVNKTQRRSHYRGSQNLSTTPPLKNLNISFLSEFPKCRLNIGQSRYEADQRPIDQNCDCPTCTHGISRAYLHHLFRARELLYYRLSSIHNIRFMLRTCETLRKLINGQL